jgi:CheY-like chemotaxis protein
MTPITNKLHLLLVEDDSPKRKAIEQLVMEQVPNSSMVSVHSLSTAINAIENNAFDIAIVDMSLPTYDFALDKEGGGQPEGFGGSEILRFIESESPGTGCIIITQYQEFSDKSAGTSKRIEELVEELTVEFKQILFGVFHYSGQRGSWREELKRALITIVETKHVD